MEKLNCCKHAIPIFVKCAHCEEDAELRTALAAAEERVRQTDECLAGVNASATQYANKLRDAERRLAAREHYMRTAIAFLENDLFATRVQSALAELREGLTAEDAP